MGHHSSKGQACGQVTQKSYIKTKSTNMFLKTDLKRCCYFVVDDDNDDDSDGDDDDDDNNATIVS